MSYLKKLEKFIEQNTHKEGKRVSQARGCEVRKRIKQVRLSDGRPGYEVTEYVGYGTSTYLVYPKESDYAQAEEEYKRRQG